MNKTTEEKLAKLMDDYDQAIRGRSTSKEGEDQKAKDLQDKFEILKNEAIAPIMHEIGDRLKTRGHNYEISDTGAGFTMRVVPSGLAEQITFISDAPYIAFKADTSLNRVSIITGDKSYSKINRVMTTNEMTSNKVETELINFVSKLLETKKVSPM